MEMESISEILRRCYVRQRGRIFPWGMIRILHNSVEDPPDEDGGIECWSEELVKFGNGGYYAVTAALKDALAIRDARTHREVADIPFSKISGVDLFLTEVMRSGLLRPVGKIGLMFSQRNADIYRSHEDSIEKAEKGLRPVLLTNDCFIRVDPSHAGETLLEMTRKGSVDPKYFVYKLDGTPVAFEAKDWLSWARWDPKNDPAKKPITRSEGDSFNEHLPPND